jgi:hypothetical protein
VCSYPVLYEEYNIPYSVVCARFCVPGFVCSYPVLYEEYNIPYSVVYARFCVPGFVCSYPVLYEEYNIPYSVVYARFCVPGFVCPVLCVYPLLYYIPSFWYPRQVNGFKTLKKLFSMLIWQVENSISKHGFEKVCNRYVVQIAHSFNPLPTLLIQGF